MKTLVASVCIELLDQVERDAEDESYFLEFLVTSPRAFLFNRVSELKYKSELICREFQGPWVTPLALNNENSKVFVRMRIPSLSGGRDKKSPYVEIDASEANVRTIQSILLSCKHGGKVFRREISVSTSAEHEPPSSLQGEHPHFQSVHKHPHESSSSICMDHHPNPMVSKSVVQSSLLQHMHVSPPSISAQCEPSSPTPMAAKLANTPSSTPATLNPAVLSHASGMNKRPWWSFASSLLSFTNKPPSGVSGCPKDVQEDASFSSPVSPSPCQSRDFTDSIHVPSQPPTTPPPTALSLRHILNAAGSGLGAISRRSFSKSIPPSPRSLPNIKNTPEPPEDASLATQGQSRSGLFPSFGIPVFLQQNQVRSIRSTSSGHLDTMEGQQGRHYSTGGGSRGSSGDGGGGSGGSPQHKKPRVSPFSGLLGLSRNPKVAVAPLPPLPPRPGANLDLQRCLSAAAVKESPALQSEVAESEPGPGLKSMDPTIHVKSMDLEDQTYNATEVRGSVTDLVTVCPSSLQRDNNTPGLDVVSHGSGIIAQPAVQTEAHIGEGVSITHSSIGVQLKQDILAALQMLEALSAAEGACARHVEYKGVLQQLLDPVEEAGGKLEGGFQGLAVDGATARAILESVLMEVGSHDKGQELGGGWYASSIPIRIPDEPQNELASSPAECEHAVSRNEGCPEAEDGTTEEVIMLDDVIMAQEKLSDEAASQAGRQQTACVSVMYAPLDQVSAGGQFACTCVALVVAAWVESHLADSSLLRMSDLSTAASCHGSCGISPEVLSELVLQGCRLWRQSAVIGSQNEDVSRSEVTMRSGRVPEVQTDARGSSSRGSESMLGFHAALDLYNSCCFSPKASTDVAPSGQQYIQEQGMVRLWEVQSAYSQVGPKGLADPGTTFPSFAAAASAAVQMPDGACFKAEARHSAPSLTYLLVAAAHCTVVCFLPDGRVRLINSLGRSLAPTCRSAHVIEFKGVQDFCAVYVGMVLPPGQEAVQVEAHRISVSAPAAAGGGEPELLLYLPPE